MAKTPKSHSRRSKRGGQMNYLLRRGGQQWVSKKGGQTMKRGGQCMKRGGQNLKRGGQYMKKGGQAQINNDVNAAGSEMYAASSNLGQAAQQGFNDVSSSAQQGFNNVSVGAQNAMSGLVSGAQSGVASVESAINQGAEKAKEGAQGIFGQVKSWFSGGGKSRRHKRNKKATTLNQLMGVLGLTKKRSRSHNKTKSRK